MDTICVNCGEPWDTWHLRHDIGPTPEEDGYVFHNGCRNIVLHCPCCRDNKPEEGEGILHRKVREMGNQRSPFGPGAAP